MAKYFNGKCSKPGCPQEGKAVEAWGDKVEKESKEIIDSECEACSNRVKYVVGPFAIIGSSKGDQIHYYNVPDGLPVPPLGSIVATTDPSVTNQEGPIKFGDVVSVENIGPKN